MVFQSLVYRKPTSLLDDKKRVILLHPINIFRIKYQLEYLKSAVCFLTSTNLNNLLRPPRPFFSTTAIIHPRRIQKLNHKFDELRINSRPTPPTEHQNTDPSQSLYKLAKTLLIKYTTYPNANLQSHQLCTPFFYTKVPSRSTIADRPQFGPPDMTTLRNDVTIIVDQFDIQLLDGMNYPFQNSTPIYPSAENAALYFNSLSNYYDYSYANQPSLMSALFPINLGYPIYSNFPSHFPSEAAPERPTDDHDPIPIEMEAQEPILPAQSLVPAKEEQICIKRTEKEGVKEQAMGQGEAETERPKTMKNLKKNTQLNLINNIYSYISCEKKSHRTLHSLLQKHEKIKIFYIFMNNLKRLNTKYLNHRDLKNISELRPNQPQAKVLAKSVRRLLVLPITELRVVLRKSIFHYLRADQSLLPLLTSKKICKNAIKQHLRKRRQLIHFMMTEVQDCNATDPTQKPADA